MNDKDIEIIVDDREARYGAVKLLEANQAVIVSIHHLQRGDYCDDGKILIERKTLPDLIKSNIDGRLFSQALRLQEMEQQPWSRGKSGACPRLRMSHTMMTIEGTSNDIRNTDMSREAIQGALIILTLYLGIPIMRSRNLHETVQLMLYAARQGRTIVSDALPRRGRRPKGRRACQIRFMQGLPNIGPHRAAMLLDYFGSIEQIVTTDALQLSQFEGIEKKTAHAIRWVVD